MLTARGWWLLTFVIFLLAMGAVLALRGPATMLLIGLALFLWFTWEWTAFAVQVLGARNLAIHRTMQDERGKVSTFWAGRNFRVSLRARLVGRIPLTCVRFSDRTPGERDPAEGAAVWSGALAPGDEATWSYRLQCPEPGAARFDGVRVQLADPQGFFYFETMLRDPVTVPVLPTLVDTQARQRTNKRFNLLPPPGLHRLRRPGSGSELLDLRDYRPGDPPKRIAWKASARRDRLITREFESEVPLRCTLFVDASDSVRLGPPGRNVLAGLVSTAAAVTQAAAGNRDLVGLAICDEHRADYVAPARTPTHVVALLRKLATAAKLAPATEAAEVGPLLNRALPVALDIYPDLMRPSINRFPGWLAWLRPQPGWTMRRPTWGDRIFGSTLATLSFVGITGILVLAGFATIGAAIAMAIPVLALCGFGLIALTLILAASLTANRRRIYAIRKRLAALIGVVYDLPLGATGQLLEDDAACSGWLQRFLSDHQVSYDVPLYDDRGRYLFARPAKVGVMAHALTRSVGRGHDNELFVLLADLIELEGELAPLLKAARVARSRHHQVVIVCPWPAGAPQRRRSGPELPPPDADPDELVRYAAEARAARAWQSVRRAFGRLGVPVLGAAPSDTARLILHRLEQLRAMQGGRRA
jgi:uncharacterized protein (DUF58 family)